MKENINFLLTLIARYIKTKLLLLFNLKAGLFRALWDKHTLKLGWMIP